MAVVSATETLRAATRARKMNSAVLARELGISNETLLRFVAGADLSAEVKCKLTTMIWSDHIKYDPANDCFLSANNTPSSSQHIRPPQYVPGPKTDWAKVRDDILSARAKASPPNKGSSWVRLPGWVGK